MNVWHCIEENDSGGLLVCDEYFDCPNGCPLLGAGCMTTLDQELVALPK